jgi:AcrR family transcriptional regulator
VRKVDPVKHDEKRREILEAARRCFVRDGFRGASISDICAEAKISPGHLYHYFESKEAIVSALAEARLEKAATRFAQMMNSSNLVSALVSEIEERAKTNNEHAFGALQLEMLAEAGRNPSVGSVLQKRSRQVRSLMADYLREAQKRGQVDPTLDPDLTAAILMGVIDGTKVAAIRDPSLNLTRTLPLVKTLISRFLTSPRDGARMNENR